MEEGLKIKTNEELHEMTVDAIREYKRRIYSHCADITAIVDYRERIGEPKMLTQPEVVEFEEEE